jgi:hypothetical protein
MTFDLRDHNPFSVPVDYMRENVYEPISNELGCEPVRSDKRDRGKAVVDLAISRLRSSHWSKITDLGEWLKASEKH